MSSVASESHIGASFRAAQLTRPFNLIPPTRPASIFASSAMPNEGNVPGAPSQEPDSFWPFRMGLPGPLPPPPVLFKAYGHQYPDDWDDICQRSRALCIQCGLTVRGTVDLVWRTNKYLPGSVPEATLLVNSPWDAEATEKWSLASERVYAFLTSKDLSSIHVEINDLDKTENMYSFPALGANAPITEVWERGDDPLERRVLNSIKGLAWSTLSVLGNDEDPHRPTILLRVWNPRHLVWKEKTSEIRALCSHHLTAVVDVAILQAYEVRFGAGHVREPREFTELCFGASIEAKDQSLGAGTLGGFFELEQKGARRVQIALTCYHVIRALNLRSGMCGLWSLPKIVSDADSTQGVDDTGFTAETSRQYNVETISPAQVDTDATLEAWRTVVAQQEERIRSFEKVLFLDPDNVRYEQAKERATRTLTNASDKVSQIQSANVCVGPVIATGGYRQDTEGWPLDWAIVETGNRRPRTRNEVSLTL